MKKKNKRSQSSIIVTVLLVLVSIAAVVLLSAWVIPMVRDNLAASALHVDISMDRDGTFYNDNTNLACPFIPATQCVSDSKTYVMIKRGTSDTTPLYAIKFIFKVGAQSLVYINKNIPAPAEYRTYSFALVGVNKPTSVQIAPVVLVNGAQKTLDIIDTVDLRTDSSSVLRYKLESCSSPANTGEDLPLDPICTG
jgi:hypothetical protein